MKIEKQVKNYLKIGLICLAIGLLLGTLIAFAATPSSTFYISSGVYPGAPSYTVWREDSNYFAKDANGLIKFSGTNFTLLMENPIAALPSDGGKILIRKGAYAGHIVIDRSNVILEGEGGVGNVPVPNSDVGNPPTSLSGTVITPEEGYDAFRISGANRTGIQIRNFGIWFKTEDTGDAIATDHDNQFHLKNAIFENIEVLDHDKNSYAINLDNFLFVTVRHIHSYGGCILRLYANFGSFHQGDSYFGYIFGHVKYDLAPIDADSGPFPIFVSRNGSEGACITNDLVIDLLEMTNSAGQSDSDYYSCILYFLINSVFNHLHIEGAGGGYGNQTFRMGGCSNIQFNQFYSWTINAVEINSANTNTYCTWISATVHGDVFDDNETNVWLNPWIVGDIHADSKADFQNLVGNSGNDAIASGVSSKTVTATFIGVNNYVLITVIDADAPSKSLKVDNINRANNQFTVMWDDEGTVAADVDFYWTISHVP